MEFIGSSQITPGILEKENFDFLIVAAGYEPRAVYLIENYHIRAEHKIAFSYSENEQKAGENNKRIFEKHGFSFVRLSGSKYLPLENELKIQINSVDRENISILVDYSCMTKLWYASMINFFISEQEAKRNIKVFFSYTLAAFGKNKHFRLAFKFRPLSLGSKQSGSDKPTALIIGLGMEKGLADIAIKKIKPDVIYLMYADPSPDTDYVQQVFLNNHELVEQTEIKNLVNYPMDNLDQLSEILTKTALQLRLKYNVRIISLGPKVFSLISFLLASRFPDINVWKMGWGQTKLYPDRRAIAGPLILKVQFSNIEDG